MESDVKLTSIIEQLRGIRVRLTEDEKGVVTHASIGPDSKVSREVFEDLSRLPGLVHLSVYDADVSDEQLEPIRKLQNLKRLELNGHRVTDESLRYVGEISGLERLNLSNPTTGSSHPPGCSSFEH